jgi:hypothetical protein
MMLADVPSLEQCDDPFRPVRSPKNVSKFERPDAPNPDATKLNPTARSSSPKSVQSLWISVSTGPKSVTVAGKRLSSSVLEV